MTPEIIKIEIANLVREVEDGNTKALNAYVKLRELKSFIEDQISTIENQVFSELYNYTKYTANVNGIVVKVMSRKNYTYDCQAYNDAKERLNAIMNIAKNLRHGEQAADENGLEILPPTVTETNYLKIEVAK